MIPQWLQDLAQGRFLFLALLLWLGFSGVLFKLTSYPTLRAANEFQPLLEERFGYGHADAVRQMRVLGEWRESYCGFEILDCVNAALKSLLLAVWLAFSLLRLSKPNSPMRLLIVFPLLYLIIELIENALLYSLAASYPDLSHTLVSVANIVTRIKFLIGSITLALVVVGLIAAGVRAAFKPQEAR
jgi:hypothetical protein